MNSGLDPDIYEQPTDDGTPDYTPAERAAIQAADNERFERLRLEQWRRNAIKYTIWTLIAVIFVLAWLGR
jgi:hypothetical protein